MSEQTPQASRKLQIRKYPNRRYYDSTRSRHVTLEEIHALIREGYDIQVTDSRTEQDITGKVLAQIILELDPPKLDVFPAPLLHKLLRSSEKLVTDFVQKYFNEALDSFLDSQRNMEQALRSAMGLPTSAPTLADMTKTMWSGLQTNPWTSPDAQTPRSASTPPAGEQENLRAVIAELQAENTRLRRPRKKPRKGRRAGR